MNLGKNGHATLPSGIATEYMDRLRDSVFSKHNAGTRCLLDHPLVREVALALRARLSADGILDPGAAAIQAISFDKTGATNWKVPWHQDLMFPFAAPVTADGFDLPCRKDQVDYARPPRAILEELLAVRLHLDDCDAENGPLRVAPGSHTAGIVKTADIPSALTKFGEATCLAGVGDVVLMRPLTLHASSQATSPSHRRVLHFVFHCGSPPVEAWHRSVV